MSAQAVEYVKAKYRAANPVLGGRALMKTESIDLFNELAAAFDAGRASDRQPRTITVTDSLGTSHFHADGRIEHER